MSVAKVRDLVVKIKADADGYKATIDDVSRKNAAMVEKSRAGFQSIGGAAKLAGGAIAAIGTAAAAAAVTMGGLTAAAASQAAEYDKIARTLGVNVEQYQAMEYASLQYRLEQEELADGLKDMSERITEYYTIGSGEAVDFFENTNAQVKDFIGLAPDQMFYKMLQELSKVEDQQERNLYLLQIMGDSGYKLSEAAADGGQKFKELEAQIRNAGGVMSTEMVAEAARFDAIMKQFSETTARQMDVALVALTPTLEKFTGLLQDAVTGFAVTVDANRDDPLTKLGRNLKESELNEQLEELERNIRILDAREAKYGWTVMQAEKARELKDQYKEVSQQIDELRAKSLAESGIYPVQMLDAYKTDFLEQRQEIYDTVLDSGELRSRLALLDEEYQASIEEWVRLDAVFKDLGLNQPTLDASGKVVEVAEAGGEVVDQLSKAQIDALKTRYDALLASLSSESEALEKWYAEQQQLLSDHLAAELSNETQYTAQKLKLDAEYESRKAEMAAKEDRELQNRLDRHLKSLQTEAEREKAHHAEVLADFEAAKAKYPEREAEFNQLIETENQRHLTAMAEQNINGIADDLSRWQLSYDSEVSAIQAKIEQLEGLRELDKENAELYTLAILGMKDRLKESSKETNDELESIFGNFTGLIGNWADSIGANLKDIESAFSDTIASMGYLTDGISAFFSTQADLSRQEYQNEVALAQAKLNNGEQLTQAERQRLIEARERAKEQFETNQTLAKAGVIANGLAAGIRVFAELPYWAAIPAAIGIGLQTTAAWQQIDAQTFDAPAIPSSSVTSTPSAGDVNLSSNPGATNERADTTVTLRLLTDDEFARGWVIGAVKEDYDNDGVMYEVVNGN